MMDYILFKNIDGKYLTLEDCINENKKEEAPAENTEAVSYTHLDVYKRQIQNGFSADFQGQRCNFNIFSFFHICCQFTAAVCNNVKTHIFYPSKLDSAFSHCGRFVFPITALFQTFLN